MEVDEDSEDTEAKLFSETAAVFVTSTTTKLLPDSKEDAKMTQIRESVSPSMTNTTFLHSDSMDNDLKPKNISNTTVELSIIEDPPKIAGKPQCAATVDSSSMMTVSKGPDKSTISTSAPISSPGATTPSCTTGTVTTFKLRPTADKCAATNSSVAATTSKGTAAKPNASSSSKIEHFKTTNQTTAASQATATSVKCKVTETSAKTALMRDSVGPNADVSPNLPKSNARAAPHLTAVTSDGSENKNPTTEPSHASTSKTKPMEGPLKVGKYFNSCHSISLYNLVFWSMILIRGLHCCLYLIGRNQVITVVCDEKQQVYCQLCSVRMRQSNHLYSRDHQYKYVVRV